MVNDSGDTRQSSKYEALLKGFGYELEGVYDRLIFFKYPDNYIYSLQFDDKSPKYIAVGFGVATAVEPATDEEKNSAVRYVNSEMKFVKLYIDEDSAQFSCEQFAENMMDLKFFIEASVQALQAAYGSMVEKFPTVM